MKLKFLLGASLLCSAFVGQAAEIIEIGAPPGPLPRLSSYGVDVPTKAALKALVPEGWVIFAHRDTELPEAVNWKAGDTWPQALGDMASTRGIAVKLDWGQRAVYLSPAESVAVAATDVVEAMNPQAKTFTSATLGEVLEHVVARHRLAVNYDLPINPQIPGPVTLLGVDAGEDLDLLARALGNIVPVTFELYRSTPALVVTENDSGASKVIVHKHTYAGVLNRIPAPIEKASGPVLVVRDPAPLPEVLAPVADASPVAEPAPTVEATEAIAASPAPVAEPEAPAPTAPVAVEPVNRTLPSTFVEATPVVDPGIAYPVRLELAEGDSLRDGLSATLKDHSWTLVWRASPDDLQATVPVTLTEVDVPTLLNRLLPRIGMRADVFLGNQTVVIRNISNQVNP